MLRLLCVCVLTVVMLGSPVVAATPAALSVGAEVVAAEAGPADTATEEMEVDQPTTSDGEQVRIAELQLQNAVLVAKAELEDAARGRSAIILGLLGGVIGMFGIVVTGIILVATLQTGKAVTASVKAEMAEMRPLMDDARRRVEDGLEIIEGHKNTAAKLSEKLQEIVDAAERKQELKPEQRDALDVAVAELKGKPLAELSPAEFRTRIAGAQVSGDWRSTHDLAITMRLLLRSDIDVSYALFAEGFALGEWGRFDGALAAYDELLARFEGCDELEVLDRLAAARVNKGVVLGRLGLQKDVIVASDEFVGRFGNSDMPMMRRRLAIVLVNKGVALGLLLRFEEAISVYDDVVKRFSDSDARALQKWVATALVNKSVALYMLGRFKDQIEVCDYVVKRFGDSDAPALRELIALAHFNRACAFAQLNNVDDARSALNAWKAISGPIDCAKIRNEADFDPIRSDPAFIDFLRDNGCLDDDETPAP